MEHEPPGFGDEGALSEWGSPRIRIVGLAIAVALLIPLVTARTLQPSVSGLGTHQQLGLPPCSMRVIFGIRCPACGMTTSWSHFTRGQFNASFATNTGGMGLAILALSVVGVSFASVWTGRLPSVAIRRNLSIAVVAIGIITIADWLFRLWRH